MVIAVDYRGIKEYRHFIYESFTIITAKHHQHTFVFISDKPFDASFTFSENIITEVVKQTKISLLSQHKISSLLKKYKSDVFVTAGTLKTNVPQVLIAFDKITSRPLKRAQIVIVGSAFSKKEIVRKYKIDENKIDVVYKGVDEIFQPVTFEEKQNIKDQYAEGNEYFLCTVKNEPGNLLNLLKAFSVFKKMQKSNMQLLIVFDTAMDKEFSDALRLYKFKSEVKLLEKIRREKSAEITAGAYAFVYPFMNEGYLPALEAIKCNVPVITSSDEEIIEICSDAALYFNSYDHKDIADKMMLIYKDENLRQQLIEKEKEQLRKYSSNNSANLLWKCIEKACR